VTAVTSIWLDANPAPYHMNKMIPHDGGNGYNTHHLDMDRQDTRTIPPTMGWDP
jgi:hypothetical protein